MSLKNVVFMKRLKPIGLDKYVINLPFAEINQMVSRKFICLQFMIGVSSHFSSNKRKKMSRAWDYQSYAPQTPGG